MSLAADRLGLSQPAVSNALIRLRGLLDDALFVRTRHGMEPTALALSLAGAVEQSLATIRAALGDSLSFDPATAARTFTLLMIDVGEITLLPGLVAGFSKRAPGIRLKVLGVPRRDYEGYLDSGAADLAVGAVELSKAFRSQALFDSSYVGLLDRGHPAVAAKGGRGKITREGYFGARHVAVVPRGATEHDDEPGLPAEARRRRIVLSVPNMTVLSSILPGTDLVASVPDVAVAPLCRGGRLRGVPLPFPVKPNRVSLWWHKRHDRDAGHQWLRGAFAAVRPAGPRP